MQAPRLIGQWVFILKCGDDNYQKCKILGEWKKNNTNFLKILWDSGTVSNLNWDFIVDIVERKKAEIIELKPKFNLLKNQE